MEIEKILDRLHVDWNSFTVTDLGTYYLLQVSTDYGVFLFTKEKDNGVWLSTVGCSFAKEVNDGSR